MSTKLPPKLEFDGKMAQEEAWQRLKGKHETEPIQRVARAEWFEAGAIWQFEQLQPRISELDVENKANSKAISDMNRQIEELRVSLMVAEKELQMAVETLKFYSGFKDKVTVIRTLETTGEIDHVQVIDSGQKARETMAKLAQKKNGDGE
jgi:hypothetical protein